MTERVRSMSRTRLLLATAGAALAAGVVLFAGIIPAEYGRDPTGLGKLAGTLRLWAPDETQVDVNGASGPLAREYATAPRSDVVEIPLSGFLGGAANSELEYKVAMKPGATLVYSWEVTGAEDGRDFRFDFHGHTTPKAKDQAMSVATYRQGSGVRGHGALTAPFDGIQGWQFSNMGDGPVVVRLRLTGFYDLIPAGEPGNEAGIVANVPADRARPAAAQAAAGG